MKDIGQLKANKRNPRKMTKERAEALRKSMFEFGDLGGIILNRHTNSLVGGHQRVSVIPKDAPITIEKTYNPPTKTGTVAEGFVIIDGERFKYREVNWTEAKERAAMIAANAHGGEWDMDILKQEMKFLGDSGIDLNLTGMDLKFDDVKMDFSTPKMDMTGPGISQESPKKTEKEETDEEYVKNTPETTEEIDVERPSNVKYEKKGFDEVEEQQGVKGQRFVIIIDCKDQESKAALKAEIDPLLEKHGARVF